ncbi:MAG: alpha/beta fold hydrolase [Thermoleophilaceae bacterium]
MRRSLDPIPFEVLRQIPGGGSLTLRGEQAGPEGDAPPLVLLHGLSATRRNVVQGSRHLVRRGYRLVAYDARGHGESDPSPDPTAYGYDDLQGDLRAVLDERGLERRVLVGSSMGAATAMAFAIGNPEGVRALVQVTPAYTGRRTTEIEFEVWDRMANDLEGGGVDAFVDAATPEELPERWRELAREATRQRMERHRHLDAVSAAMRVVPRSRAFDGLEPLDALDVPTLVVGSRDEADTIHPLDVAREYAERLPRGELLVEDEGQTPLAWQGARLSSAIGDFLERVGVPPQA